VRVRERETADERPLLDIARRVHLLDGYPLYLPDADYASFLFGHATLGAWVAEDGRDVLGQVALHPRASRPVMALAATALNVPDDRLGVVARLLVDPERRRLGAGGALLDRAAREAVSRGLRPILDVVSALGDAIGLYEREGWRRLGEVTVTLGGEATVREYVYAAPSDLGPS
jgi:GNAT superfamily N-acetyltransferase